jgi:peptide-methionine (R)-S-oxide reductase
MVKAIILGVALAGITAAVYTQNRGPKKNAVAHKEQAVTTSERQATTNAKSIANASADTAAPGTDPEKVDWSKIDWRSRLTPEQFAITREAGTERPFTGKYDKLFDAGQYNCVCCGLPLFESTSKFDSHCGWPSFDQTIAKDAVVELEDNSHFMRRVEIRCRRCNAHLGHVFDDGPTKTGLRYCMNSASLNFVPAKDALAKRDEAAAPAPPDAGAPADEP